MGVLNPFLVIVLVPVFEGLIYPVLGKYNIWTCPLHRMGWGGFLAMASFVIAGFLQLAVDRTMVKLPEDGQGHLMVASFSKCAVLIFGHNGFSFTMSLDRGKVIWFPMLR